MKTIIYFLIISLFTVPVFSQIQQDVSEKDQKQLQKEAKKSQKEEEKRKVAEYTLNLIESRRFVLEADQLSGRSGTIIPVNPTLNFVSVDSNSVIIQLGSNTGVGANGVGGVTTEGNISKFDIRKNKKGDSFTVRTFTNTTLGAFDIVFFISGNGDAQADVTQSTTGVVRRYYGRIIPLENSRVYKGRSI